MATNDVSIHTNAMLVNLSLGAWTARKLDKEVTAQVNEAHGAEPDATRTNKQLIGKDSSYGILTKLIGEVRTWNYQNSLDWATGWRLLPTANFPTYSDKIREFHARFDDALADFVRDYPFLIERARMSLNGMFKESDYPAPHAVADKFQMSVDYAPVPASGDFRVDLEADVVASIENTVQDRIKIATETAVKDIQQRLVKAVGHMSDTLHNPTATFRDTLVVNLRELAALVPKLNITNDPDITDMVAAISGTLDVEPDTLRKDGAKRRETADNADKILDAMSAAFGPKVSI
jgi:hypothetical protein